ncbi:hypothetical protein, partial [Dorea formicigenerans]|uniref:hypothetical protein n=1 Tax=Dorea formicigenerans TaxID=39486 RepID=UPI001A9A6CA3
INQVVLIDYIIIILGGISVNTTSEDRRQNDIEIIDDMLKDADPEEVHLIKIFVRGYLGE